MAELTRVIKREFPHLFDKPIGNIQDGLAQNVSWLDHIFGRSERLIKEINGHRYYTPNWYVAKNDYLLLTPDQGFGNYAFFVMEEPQRLNWSVGQRTIIKSPFSLIVWVDMRSIMTLDERDTESVKQDLLRTLNGQIFVRDGSFEVMRVYERAENVFKGFTLDEVDNQFLMSPFAGWRFEGELLIRTDCISV